ncbi:MAG: FdtA/QdtA family cupin domain-containing protein [Candidatus Woesebacteria bacterium]|jgi:dTDP-4-dehydrorhamnose 3,5-epimerase-like enzyme
MNSSNTKPRGYTVEKVKSIPTETFEMNPLDLKDIIEGLTDFNLKRAYWIDSPKGKRKTGQHAHKDENGIFIVLKGHANIILDDNGKGVKKVSVQRGHVIWIPKHVWHGVETMSDDLVLMVLSDKNYDPSRKGYIESYEEFRNSVVKK